MQSLNDFSKAVQALKHAEELVRDIALKMLQDPPAHGCRWVKDGTIETDGTEYRIEKMSISRGSDGRYYWLAYCRDSDGIRKSFKQRVDIY